MATRLSARLRDATPGYFRALGVPLRRGRMFFERPDAADASALLVNEAFVRTYFPGEDPLGRVLDRGTIVGVVGDARQTLGLPAKPEIYAPLVRTAFSSATLAVSGAVPVERLATAVRAAIRDVNPNQAVFNVRPMEQVLAMAYTNVRMFLWLIGLFAALPLLVSVARIYGVVSYAVASRRKEYGIRLALGADRSRLLRQVLAQGGLLIALGVAIGIAGALALTRFLGALLHGVTPTDPLTFAAVTFLLVAVALVACLNPARRAMALDPVTVLRCE